LLIFINIIEKSESIESKMVDFLIDDGVKFVEEFLLEFIVGQLQPIEAGMGMRIGIMLVIGEFGDGEAGNCIPVALEILESQDGHLP
jgi:hypothetical protein